MGMPIDINVGSYVTQIMFWVGWSILGIILVLIFLAIITYMTHNIKATVFTLYGSGQDGVFSFGKPKKNRIKWSRDRKYWQSLFPLFNKKRREPFDQEFIYPGNEIFVFEINGEWIPGRININKTEDEIRAEVNPIPYYVRNWLAAEDKIDDSEFSKDDFWNNNKMLIMTIIAVAVCCALAGVTIYFTYQFATPGTEAMNNLASSLKNFGNMQARPVG